MLESLGSLASQEWSPEPRRNVDRLINFRFDGRLAFIEALPDYEDKRDLLRQRVKRRVVTAVAVGEVSNHDTSSWAALAEWFPIDLLEVLEFASGIPVGSPGIQIRDAEGDLLTRYAITSGHPVFYSGRAVIDGEVHGGIGELLTRFLFLPVGERLYLRAAMSHAMRGGLRAQNTEDRLASLFRGFECVCRAQGFGTQNLANELDGENRELVEQILNNAAQQVRAAAERARSERDDRQRDVLGTIASRVQNAKNMDKSFNSQLRELLDHLGLHDAEVADVYFRARAGENLSGSWLQAINRYRNAVVHHGFLNVFGGGYDEEEIQAVMVHLHDLLTRVVLKLLGYTGTYQPTVTRSRSSRKVDWLTPDTSPSLLGYFSR